MGARFSGLPDPALRDRHPPPLRKRRETGRSKGSGTVAGTARRVLAQRCLTPFEPAGPCGRFRSPFASHHRPAPSSGRASGLRSLARPAARSLSPLEACPGLLSASAALAGRVRRLRRLLRAADRRHESGGRPSLDSLAGTGGPGITRERQCLLHGVPIHAAADTRAALAIRRRASWPSWLRNKWPAVLLVVVFLWAYEAFALWDSPWLTAAIVRGVLRAGLPDRRSLSRRIVLQVCLPDRPVQFRAFAGLAARDQGARPGRLLVVPLQRLHQRPRRHPRLRARPLPAAEVEQHGLHVLPGLYSRVPPPKYRHRGEAFPRRSSGATLAGPASAGSAGASTWPRCAWCWSSAPSRMPH